MIAALLMVGGLFPQGSVRMERDLAHWKPEKVWANPFAQELAIDADLSGTWKRPGRMDLAEIQFTSKGNGRYGVEFTSVGCLNGWRLLRTATFKDGVILLNKPVKDYAGWTYDRLYSTHVGSETRLVWPEAYYEPGSGIGWFSFEPKTATSDPPTRSALGGPQA